MSKNFSNQLLGPAKGTKRTKDKVKGGLVKELTTNPREERAPRLNSYGLKNEPPEWVLTKLRKMRFDGVQPYYVQFAVENMIENREDSKRCLTENPRLLKEQMFHLEVNLREPRLAAVRKLINDGHVVNYSTYGVKTKNFEFPVGFIWSIDGKAFSRYTDEEIESLGILDIIHNTRTPPLPSDVMNAREKRSVRRLLEGKAKSEPRNANVIAAVKEIVGIHEVQPQISGNNGSATNTDDVKTRGRNSNSTTKKIAKEVRRTLGSKARSQARKVFGNQVTDIGEKFGAIVLSGTSAAKSAKKRQPQGPQGGLTMSKCAMKYALACTDRKSVV